MRKLQTQGVHHITLVGADRQTSIDFWEGVLGMPFVFEQPNLDRALESHLYFDPGDGRLITVFTDESRKPDPTPHADRHRLRAPPRLGGQRGHLPPGGRAARRARHRALGRQGPRLHGLDLLQGPARPPDRARLLPLRAAAGATPTAQVLMEAHRIRTERGDYAIAEIHLADAIERLTARNRESLSPDRGPKDPYTKPDKSTDWEETMKLYMHPASITSRHRPALHRREGARRRRGGRRPLHRRPPPGALRLDQPEPAGAGARGRRLPADRERGDPDLPRREVRPAGIPEGREGAGQGE